MSITVAIAIYSSLVALVSSLMIYYYAVRYPQEEAKLREKSK
jgi:ABC-type Fe3+ transport system permease subunit